jgi:hypothetical protein
MITKFEKVFKASNFIIICFIIIINGCSTSKLANENRSRGSLTEAIKKSSDDYEGERKVNSDFENSNSDNPFQKSQSNSTDTQPLYQSSTTNHSTNSDFINSGTNLSSERKPTVNDELFQNIDFNKSHNDSLLVEKIKEEELKGEYKHREVMRDYVFFNINAKSGSLHSDSFYGYNQLGLGLFGFISDKRSIQIDFNIGHSNIQETSELSKSLKTGVDFIDIYLSTKRFYSKDHTFLSPFFCVGFGWSWMFWKYKNPIEVIENSNPELIKSDFLSGLDVFAGFGAKLFQAYPFNLSFQLTPGVKIWNDETHKDFENDYFDPITYLIISLQLEFKTGL